MLNIILVSCNTTATPYPVYPLGMSLVAEAARAQGHRVREYDLYVFQNQLTRLTACLQQQQPDIIGLSLRNVDDVDYQIQQSYLAAYTEVVKAIRLVCRAPIVLGGSAFTLFPEDILTLTGADYGIAGEGEQAFIEFLKDFEAGAQSIKKIRQGSRLMGGEDLLCRGREPELARFYLHKGGMLNLQTKRGCPHRCLYCSYPGIEGCTYRFRPKEAVADEIELLIRDYQADYLSITDSVFNDASGKYLEIAEEIIRRDIHIPWMCFLRPARFHKEEAEILKRAGLTSIEWGTDCATDTTLEKMQKDFCWEDVIHSNALFASLGVANSHFIIFGGPGETQATVQQGLENISRLPPAVVFASLGIRIFPHTPFYDQLVAGKLGPMEPKDLQPKDLLSPRYFLSAQIEGAQVQNAIAQSFGGRMDRVYSFGTFTEKIQAFHLLGHRGPVWDYLLKAGLGSYTRKRQRKEGNVKA